MSYEAAGSCLDLDSTAIVGGEIGAVAACGSWREDSPGPVWPSACCLCQWRLQRLQRIRAALAVLIESLAMHETCEGAAVHFR